MAMTSISDLTRNLILREANAATKRDLITHSREVATGIRNDIAGSLGGNTTGLGQLEAQLAVLSAYHQTGLAMASRTETMQLTLDALQAGARSLGPTLLQAVAAPSHHSVSAVTAQATRQLADVIGQINIEIGGQYLFSGTASSTAPLPDAETLLTAARDAIGIPGSVTDMIAAIEDFFAAPPGGGGFSDNIYKGTTTAVIGTIATGQKAAITVNASDPAIRETLKGLVLLALSDEPPWAANIPTQAKIIEAAGHALLAADSALSLLRGDLGLTESTIAEARTHNAAASSALQLARNDLIGADQFEAAASLAQAEARMEAIYALTARLSRLSLAAYL